MSELYRFQSGRFKRWLWRRRVVWCWKKVRPDVDQFYSNVGYFIACGKLPIDILEDHAMLRSIKA